MKATSNRTLILRCLCVWIEQVVLRVRTSLFYRNLNLPAPVYSTRCFATSPVALEEKPRAVKMSMHAIFNRETHTLNQIKSLSSFQGSGALKLSPCTVFDKQIGGNKIV